jgi:hypothetical protein
LAGLAETPAERHDVSVTVILPPSIQEEILTFPEYRMGVHGVTVTLADGRTLGPAEVAWGSEVVRVLGRGEIPFSGEEVVSVADASQA